MSRNIFTRIALPVTAIAAAAVMGASLLLPATAAPAAGQQFGLAEFGFTATAPRGVSVDEASGNHWCLSVASQGEPGSCEIEVVVGTSDYLNPNSDQTYMMLESKNKSRKYCDDVVSTKLLDWSSHAQIAGRRGEFRHWEETMHDGEKRNVAQYVLTNNPSVVIRARNVSPKVLDAMKFVAKHSKINKTTDSVRGWDEGIVQRTEKRGGTTKVWLDRIAPDGSNVNKQTYVYLVDQARDIETGDAIAGEALTGRFLTIFTDGRRVQEALVK